MKEASLYPPLVAGALRCGWPLYRIRDDAGGRKPFDIGGCSARGLGVALEAKVIRSSLTTEGYMPWDLFEPHQQQWLRVFANTGAIALAVFYWQANAVVRAYRVPNSTNLMPLGMRLCDMDSFELQYNTELKAYIGWPTCL